MCGRVGINNRCRRVAILIRHLGFMATLDFENLSRLTWRGFSHPFQGNPFQSMSARHDETKTRLKLLVLSELDGQILRVNRLCERLVCSDDGDIDAILVSGGLVAPRAPREYEALEAVAAAEGDMMALVSRLEMIVCRVLYIPDDVRAHALFLCVLHVAGGVYVWLLIGCRVVTMSRTIRRRRAASWSRRRR